MILQMTQTVYELNDVESSSQASLFEFENFRGKKVELSAECKDLIEKNLERVGSLIVESGPWVHALFWQTTLSTTTRGMKNVWLFLKQTFEYMQMDLRKGE